MFSSILTTIYFKERTMKDLKQMAIWVSLTIAVIYFLINISDVEGISSNLVVGSAIFFVIVLPIVLAIRLSKKEREQQ